MWPIFATVNLIFIKKPTTENFKPEIEIRRL